MMGGVFEHEQHGVYRSYLAACPRKIQPLPSSAEAGNSHG